MRVSSLIPDKTDPARLQRCLPSSARAAAPAIRTEMVVADNGSTDASTSVAASAGARVLNLPGLRVSELRNRGAAAATGEILAFVDADHEIGASWLTAAVDALQSDRVGAAGALYT